MKATRAKVTGRPKAARAKPKAKAFRIPDSDRAVIDGMDELFGDRPELRKGAMFGCPGYFLGTKAVACVYGDKLNLTLPQERIVPLLAKPGFTPFIAHGRAMSGWVLVDLERLSSMDRDDELLTAAIAHARSKAKKPG